MANSRLTLLCALTTSLCLGMVAAGPAAAKTPCPAQKKSGKPIGFTSQVSCWINYERKSRHLHRYKSNKKLAGVAQAHSARMDALNVFSHEIGGNLFDRIQTSGYFKGARSFGIGETIVWVPPGSGARAATMTWLNSPYHRSILLNRTLRDYGVGVVVGSPYADGAGGHTVTGVYGKRK
jgi:uncharacterized protein YkwD